MHAGNCDQVNCTLAHMQCLTLHVHTLTCRHAKAVEHRKEKAGFKIAAKNAADIAVKHVTGVCAMWEISNNFPNLTAHDVWARIKRDHLPSIPYIFQLACIMFTIPVQSATVERGFSMHRVFKNRLSNRLRLVTLDSLMRVKLLSPSQLTKSELDAAVLVIQEKGGMNDKHPMLIGRLFRAACNVEVPIDMVEGVDLEHDPNALDYPSDASDASDDEGEAGAAGQGDESDSESDATDAEEGAAGAEGGEQAEDNVADALAAAMGV
jgi:hypothetical protein